MTSDLWETQAYLEENYDLDQLTAAEVVDNEKRDALEDFRVVIGQWRDKHWDEKIDDAEFAKQQRQTQDTIIKWFKDLDEWEKWKTQSSAPQSGQ